MQIRARFTYDTLDHSKDNAPHLVVSLQAPALDWIQRRPALCVLPIVDLSGSMRGPKLEYAKKSLLKLVEQLQPGDFVGLAGFESRVHVIESPREVTSETKTRLMAAISKLHALGGTNLCDGVLQSIRLVQQLDLPPHYLRRLIVFTDGQPTEGVTDPATILRLVTDTRGEITLSAFGYGAAGGGTWGGCDQDFLLKFSAEGAGNYAYVQNPDDSLAAFGKELGGLLSTYAQDIEVEIEPVAGHHITRMVSELKHQQDVTGQTEVSIPSVLCEESRHLVFETKFPQQPDTAARAAVFNVRCRFSVLTQSGDRETRSLETTARVDFVRVGDEQRTPHRDLDEIVALAQVVRAQLEAEDFARKGDFRAASEVMQTVEASARARGLSGVGAAATSIRKRLSSAEEYGRSHGYLRSFSAGAARAYGTSSMDESALADLAACNVSMGNTAMHDTMRTFAEPLAPDALESTPLVNASEEIANAT